MRLFPLRLRTLLLLPLLTLILAGTAARAELVWTPQTGWRLEGGLVTGLTGEDGRNALDLMNKARENEEQKDYLFAARGYEKVADRYPLSVYAPEALYRAAQMRMARRQYYKAFDNLLAVIDTYPNSTRFNEIVGEMYRIGSALLDGARNWMLWGFMPGPKFPEQGIEYFETLINRAPYSDYAPLALMNVGRGHMELGDTELAIYAYDRMINDYADHPLAPDATLKLAEAYASYIEGPYYDQRDSQDAATYYLDFLINYPTDPNVGEAEKGLDEARTVMAESKIVMGDFYFYRRDNFTAARILYNDAITTYPDSEIADKARERLAEVDTREERVGPADVDAELQSANSSPWYWPF